MGRRRHAVVRLLFQLRGPAGNFLGLPDAEKRVWFQRGATRCDWLGVHVGLRSGRTGCGIPRRPVAAQATDPWWLLIVEQHHGHDRLVWATVAIRNRARAGGDRRDILFSLHDVVGEPL